MHKSGLVELEAVLAVARLRSFRAAAAALGMSPTALGNAVAHLEARISARLFHRTTRSVALTAAGERFVAEIAPAVAAIQTATARAAEAPDVPSGSLRINTSLGGARQLLAPVVFDYLRRYPAVTVELITERRMIDIVRDGFDAGIRSRERVPRDMVRVPIGGSLAFAIVASPGYLRAHGTPTAPAELAAHRCLRTRTADGTPYRWELEQRRRGARRVSHEVEVSGPLVLDDPHLALDAVRAGVGLAYLPRWMIADELARGRVTQVLADWTPETPELCLYYPTGRHPPAALRALVAMIRARNTDLAKTPLAGKPRVP